MSNIENSGIVLTLALIASGCASNRIAQMTWSEQPPPVAASSESPGAQSPSTAETRPPQRSMIEERRRHPWEFTLTGGGVNDEDYDVGNGQASATIGYYFSEFFEIVARQSATFSDDEAPPAGSTDTEDVYDFQTLIALDVHFPLGFFVPYVGVNGGYLYGDTNVKNDTWAAGPEAGVKMYLQSDAFLQIGAQWEFFADEQRAQNQTFRQVFEDGQIIYFAGIGLRF